MALRYFIVAIILIVLSGCTKKPILVKSSVIVFKTPNIKFYDKGFIEKYDDRVHLQVYNTGVVALNLTIYKDEICQSTFKCIDSKEFNREYLGLDYNGDFLYNLFSKDKIYFKDKKNKVLIKVK